MRDDCTTILKNNNLTEPKLGIKRLVGTVIVMNKDYSGGTESSKTSEMNLPTWVFLWNDRPAGSVNFLVGESDLERLMKTRYTISDKTRLKFSCSDI